MRNEIYKAKVRWIELSDPIQQWENPLVRSLFSQIMTVKILGYKPYYSNGVVPVDTTDFFANHYLIAREKPESDTGFEIISGFREVTLSRVEAHFSPFPLLSLAKSSGSQRHIQLAERFVKNSKELGRDLAYHSSFTVNPDLRAEQELVKLSIDHMHYMMHFVMQRSTFEMPVTIAVVDRFNSKIRYDDQGFMRVSDHEGLLPSIASPFLNGESVSFMSALKLSPLLQRRARECQSLWDDRLVISSEAEISEKRAA